MRTNLSALGRAALRAAPSSGAGGALALGAGVGHPAGETNRRDAWVLLDWRAIERAIEEACPRVVHRLGGARGVWTMMLDRHREHGDLQRGALDRAGAAEGGS